MVNIKKIECPQDKIKIKCPHKMTPTRIVIHNTANDASAENEVKYMHSNKNETSFHFAVDDKEIVQGIALDRNAWHAGDGNGKGNREGIAIEICYSKSGGARFEKAVKNAAELTAKLLKDYGWGIDKVTKHKDYSGKNCPHRILDEYGWDNFIKLVKGYMTAFKPTVEVVKEKPVDVFYKVRVGKKWLSEVKNLEDHAGIRGIAVTDVAIKVSSGKLRYRVHVYKGKWLPWVTGYNTADHNNGYAGNGKPIDAIEIEYTGQDGKAIQYRVAPLKKNYYPYQIDNNRTNGMDGYAGAFGRKIDRLQICIK